MGAEVRDAPLPGGGVVRGGREELREEVTDVIEVPVRPRGGGAHTYLIGSVVESVEAQVPLGKGRRCGTSRGTEGHPSVRGPHAGAPGRPRTGQWRAHWLSPSACLENPRPGLLGVSREIRGSRGAAGTGSAWDWVRAARRNLSSAEPAQPEPKETAHHAPFPGTQSPCGSPARRLGAQSRAALGGVLVPSRQRAHQGQNHWLSLLAAGAGTQSAGTGKSGLKSSLSFPSPLSACASPGSLITHRVSHPLWAPAWGWVGTGHRREGSGGPRRASSQGRYRRA